MVYLDLQDPSNLYNAIVCCLQREIPNFTVSPNGLWLTVDNGKLLHENLTVGIEENY